MTEMDFQQQHVRKGAAVKLMARCLVYLVDQTGAAAEICRGMTVICSDGVEKGKVAALAISSRSHQTSCLILGHLPEKELYQSLPIRWVDRVEGEVVYLNVRSAEIQALPEWHPDQF